MGPDCFASAALLSRVVIFARWDPDNEITGDSYSCSAYMQSI